MGDAKAAKKEGGKKGQDIAGMNDMGGVKFFNVAVETPDGDLDMLDVVLEGMNAEVDPAGEERRGGAGHVGKLLLSAGVKQLAVLCHVPKALQAERPDVSIKEWVEAVLSSVGGKVVSETEEVVKGVAEGNADEGKFPLKMRDEAQTAGFAFLREKGLIPDGGDDSSEYVPDAEAAGIEW